MIRAMLCCAVVLGAGSAARAGELDKDVSPAKTGITGGVLKATAATEMDNESPTDAWYRRGGWGHHHHYYGGGYGYAYRPIVYRPYVYRPSYIYRPALYRPYYGGLGVNIGFGGGFVSYGGYYGW